MKKYKVKVIETNTIYYEVDAENPFDAREAALMGYGGVGDLEDGYLISRSASAFVDEDDDCECCYCMHNTDAKDDSTVMDDEDYVALNDAINFVEHFSEKYGLN